MNLRQIIIIVKYIVSIIINYRRKHPKFPNKKQPKHNLFLCVVYKTDERESPQEAQPARENSSLGFIEAVHQW